MTSIYLTDIPIPSYCFMFDKVWKIEEKGEILEGEAGYATSFDNTYIKVVGNVGDTPKQFFKTALPNDFSYCSRNEALVIYPEYFI